MNRPIYHYIVLQSFVPLLQTMHRLHSCTCRLLLACTVRHASTGTSMGCVYYFLTACSNTSHASSWKGLQYQFQSRSVSCSRLQIHASVATSTFSKLPCFTRWLACEHNQCQTLVSALAPKRKITQVFTLLSAVWFTNTHTHNNDCDSSWSQLANQGVVL